MTPLETRVPSYDGAQELLLGILLQTLLTGAYIVIAAGCARTLCQRHHPQSARSWYLTATWIVLLVLIVTKSIVDMGMTIRSWSSPRTPGKPSSLAEILLTNLLLVLITVCADVFLTYRVYIVWNFSWRVIIIPSLLCAGEIGTGLYDVYAVFVAGISKIPTPATIQNITKGWAIYLYFALAANLLCTGESYVHDNNHIS
ncbi:hypothetical protein AURDEDRAFT_164353 [Auricularia subglabra TFB-10046 SS5]|nr:hypothetical protein AURDEDRAFT_164353 [Auricularia subglabra TFB-10046 SS5]